MHPDIIDGYRLRDLQRTVTIGKALLTNDLSETILIIEDNGRRTLVHPDVSVKPQDSITVSWATDCDDNTKTNKLKVLEEDDFHVINLGRSTKLRLKYLQSLPATIVIGSQDGNVSNALLRDMGKSLHPICLSEDKELLGQWVVVGLRYGPIVYQSGAGKLTVINPETLSEIATEASEYVLRENETACRLFLKEKVAADTINTYFSTMALDFSVTEVNAQNMILNEHKILQEETKQKGVELHVAKTAVDTLSRLAS